MLMSAPMFVAAACADGTVTIVDVETGTAAYCFTAHRGPVQAMSGGDWPTTPASLCSMGCVLLVTSSGDEGSVKVGAQTFVVPPYCTVTTTLSCSPCLIWNGYSRWRLLLLLFLHWHGDVAQLCCDV
jgi:hypothetical protein